MAPEQKKYRKQTIYLLRIVPFLLFLGYFIYNRELRESSFASVSKINIWLFLVAVAVLYTCQIIRTLRLKVLLSNLPCSKLYLHKSILTSLSLNAFTVYGAGEVFLVKSLSNITNNLGTASAIVVIERLIGISTFFSVGLIIWFTHNHPLKIGLDSSKLLWLVIGISLVIALTLILFQFRIIRRNIKPVLHSLPRIPNTGWLFITAYSLIIVTTTGCSIFLISRALGINLDFLDVLLIGTINLLVTILPISIGGTGIRETTYVLLFSFYALEPNLGVSLGILQYSAFIIIAAISAIAIAALPTSQKPKSRCT